MILNLNSNEIPQVQPWGNEHVHVPINIRETKTVDEKGEKQPLYVYDVVEKVPTPITVNNIVKTAAESKFGSDIVNYVAANIYKTDDETVKAYTAFVKEVSEQAKEMGYE